MYTNITNIATKEQLDAFNRALDQPVRVVRCKDCKYRNGRGHGECGKWFDGGYVDGGPPDYWYCADGERVAKKSMPV